MPSILALVLLACLFATSAFAESRQAKSSLGGVWTGSIGRLQITACFNGNYVEPNGSYYYHRHLIPIYLEHKNGTPIDSKQRWSEANATWELGNTSSDRVVGTWTASDGTRKLPIELTRLDLSADDSAADITPCGSNAYNQAIVRSLRNIVSPTLSSGNVKYRVLAAALPEGKGDAYKRREQYAEMIEIIGDSAAVAAINQSLRKLGAEPPTDFLFCRHESMNSFAREGSSVQNMFVSTQGRWLKVRVIKSGDCGGFGVHRSENAYVWDVTTGQQEDLFSWFKGAEIGNDEVRTHNSGRLPAALDTFIASRFGQGNHLGLKDMEGCYGEYQPGAYSYQLELTNDGIDFILPFTSHASCGESFKLTFRELRPFLNRKGRQYAAETQAALKGKN